MKGVSVRIYVEREAAAGQGFVPRRVVEHLEGPLAGPSLIAMYNAGDVGGMAMMPASGVAVGLFTEMSPDDESAPSMPWGAAAWDWLNVKVTAVERAWGAHPGARWVWPRVGEVLSDVPSLRRFLKDREGAAASSGWRFVLDPVAMLAPSMLGNADEHVMRVLETLGSHEQCGAVVLSDVSMDQIGDAPARTPIGSGELSRRGLLDWWRKACPSTLPVILGCEGAITEQVAWLTSG